MNKKLLFLLMFVFSLGLTFTACDPDDPKQVEVDYAAQVAGIYNGTLNIKVGEAPAEDITGQDIKLKRTDENKAELLIENFTFGDINAGSITIDNIPVTESNGVVKLGDISKNIPLLNGAMTADVAISSGSIKDNKLTLNIKVNNVKMGNSPMPLGDIIVTFAGTKKAN
jgi:hypothetical protein